MQKPERSALFLAQPVPVHPRLLQQRKRAHHIRADEPLRRHNRPVHVALSGEVHNRLRLILPEQRTDQFRIANIAAYKGIPLIALERRQVPGVPGVGQQVQIHHSPGAGLHPAQNKVRADEPRPAGHQNRVVHALHCHRVYDTKHATCDDSGVSFLDSPRRSPAESSPSHRRGVPHSERNCCIARRFSLY